MNTFSNKLDQFLGKKIEQAQIGEEVCDLNTGICYIKTKDGLIEDIINEEQITHKNSNKKNESNLEKYNPKIKFGGKSECYILPSKFEIIKEQLFIDFENYDNIL